jgi:hypothetical protein
MAWFSKRSTTERRAAERQKITRRRNNMIDIDPRRAEERARIIRSSRIRYNPDE